MRNTLKDLKRRALTNPQVRREYNALREEFGLLDEIFKARTEARLTRAELAEQGAISRWTP